jgi:hypothetical protein
VKAPQLFRNEDVLGVFVIAVAHRETGWLTAYVSDGADVSYEHHHVSRTQLCRVPAFYFRLMSSTLQMEAVNVCETLVPVHQTICTTSQKNVNFN